MNRAGRLLAPALVAAVLAAGPASPAHAFLGVLARLGKLGTVSGKGAAVAGGVEAVNAGGKATKATAVADEVGSATSAAQISKASGLGPAVPDEIAALLKTPGKTLADVPDVGSRAWLSIPPTRLKPADAELIAGDYVRLLEGKATIGPRQATEAAARPAVAKLPTRYLRTIVPWHAFELLVRAAHAGSRGAQAEIDRLCADTGPGKPHASCPLLQTPRKAAT